MMKKNFCTAILFRYFFCIIVLIFSELISNGELFGFFALSTSVLFCFKLIKKNMLITPFLPAEVMLICFSLYKLHLVNTMSEMELEPSLVILVSIFLWQLICSLNSYNYKHVSRIVFNLRPAITKKMIIILFFISASFIAVEWIKAGGIPALKANAETARFEVSFSSVWHIIAMAIKYVPVFSCFYWMAKNSISIKRDIFIILASIGSLLLLLGTAQRGELLSGPVIVFFGFYAYRKPSIRKLIIPIILIVIIMAVYPILRSYNAYGITYFYDMQRISKYEGLWFVTPVYQTFAYSFHILNKDFQLFPQFLPFGLGSYTLLCNVPFVDLADSLATVQNRAWNNNFYSELTPTFFGDWYADFGYFGCFWGMILICLMINMLYKNYIRKQDAMSLVLYALNFYKCICMLYDNTFDFVWITYMVLIWTFFRIAKGRTIKSS